MDQENGLEGGGKCSKRSPFERICTIMSVKIVSGTNLMFMVDVRAVGARLWLSSSVRQHRARPMFCRPATEFVTTAIPTMWKNNMNPALHH
jgi:hypothetical protein